MADLTVAKTILEQLGGSRFKTMTGASNFVASSNTLGMKLTRNKAKATHLIITLMPSDTYKMEFLRVGKTLQNKKTVQVLDGIYCDKLQSTFTAVTGLYTHF